ncbi:sporulation inhibitor of replication protein SirA [Bacillus sp. JCM 19041]|uniref:sporulation inhibitor of replication protein SirA n=1 Tax=Bacillus sp. JCM 19041 TaxID=1460637 RepID=UPI000A3F3C0A
MRHYELYLLNNEVASSYSGKEAKLFQLFAERAQASEFERSLYDKQVKYITNPLPQTKLYQALFNRYGFEKSDSYLIFSSFNSTNRCKVMIEERKICLEALGDLSAETLVFDLFKPVDPHLFAVNVKDGRFGWLQPHERQSVL